jgi:hypothetical protein
MFHTNQNQILCSIIFFKNKRAIYEIMWENKVEPYGPWIRIWRMRIARWIPKATDTHSQYVMPIAFPLQQWFKESASTLRCTYIVCL